VIQREVDILLSPLEKFLDKQVKVSTYDRLWTGTLKGFGGGWLEIEQDGAAVVIYTGKGLSVELFNT
jgi:hypothetical protein